MDIDRHLTEVNGAFSWDSPLLNQKRFCLLTKLLEWKDKQQISLSTTTVAGRDQHTRSTQALHDDNQGLDSESDNDSVEPRQLSHEKPLDYLKRRFLDRLAEILDRQKKFHSDSDNPVSGKKSGKPTQDAAGQPSKGPNSGPGHTAAASLIEDDGCALVLVAKNRGLEPEDREMMKRLSIWIRVMAKTGERNLANDSFWKELLLYCRRRISFYIKQISSLTMGWQPSAEFISRGARERELNDLLNLCRMFGDKPLDTYETEPVSKLVCLAYALRSSVAAALGEVPITKPKLLVFNIALLGRYRAAFETFKEAAMHFAAFKELKIQEVELISPKKLELDLSYVTGTLNDLRIPISDLGAKRSTRSLRTQCQSEHFFHAEMQLLVALEKQSQQERSCKIYPYLGVSKKTCFLCSEILTSFPFYRTRGSHMKVYGLWDIPQIEHLNRTFLFQFQSALLQTQNKLQSLVEQAFHVPKKSKPPFVAESSAGISSRTGASSIDSRIRHLTKILGIEQRQTLDRENSKKASDSAFDPYRPYGEVLRQIVALRLPGEGGKPSLVKAPLVVKPEDYVGSDRFSTIIPCFSAYWGVHDREKRMLSFDAKNQDVMANNGLYYIYWIENDDLQPNSYLKELLPDTISTLPTHVRFWRGDIFIVKVEVDQHGHDFDENGNSRFTDVSRSLSEARQLMRIIFTGYFEREQLEKEAESDAYFNEEEEKRERAKTLIYEKM
ncbi:MAG: hypothetical protein Q9191_003601 [Dirinaria sp. TL-2023a]